MKKNTLILLLAITLVKPALMARAADLQVDVTGIRTKDRAVMIGVYDSKESFLRQVKFHADLPASPEGVHYVFKDLAPGEYAVAVFHDINGNGHLDKRSDGIPTEPTAMSRGAVGRFGPPQYEDAVFTLPETGKQISIRLFE